MKRSSLLSILCLGPFLSCGSFLYAEEAAWPQWRGPHFDGTAAQGANPPTNFSETQNVKWKAAIPGSGASTPVIWGDKIFLQTAVGTGKQKDGSAIAAKPAPAPETPAPPTEPGGGRRRGGGGGMRGEAPVEVFQFVMLCLDWTTGKTLWQTTVKEELPHEGHHRDHGFSSHSPVTDGTHVYAWFGSRGLHCLDMTGKLVWSKDLGKMQTRNGFGEGSSPALDGDTLVVNWDHEGEDFLVAFDKKDGRELWRQPRDEETTWTTPLIVDHGGAKQVVVCATKKIRSYDLKTGKELWSCGGMTSNVIPTPIARDGVLYALSGFRGAAVLAIQLGKTGDLTDTDAVLWKHDKRTPYVPSAAMVDGRLYFHSGNDGYLSILEAKNGNVLQEAERIPGMSGIYSSPVSAAGRLYFTGRDGTVVVARAGDKLEVLATCKLDEAFEASPAIVGPTLYLRGHRTLYALEEAGK